MQKMRQHTALLAFTEEAVSMQAVPFPDHIAERDRAGRKQTSDLLFFHCHPFNVEEAECIQCAGISERNRS